MSCGPWTDTVCESSAYSSKSVALSRMQTLRISDWRIVRLAKHAKTDEANPGSPFLSTLHMHTPWLSEIQLESQTSVG